MQMARSYLWANMPLLNKEVDFMKKIGLGIAIILFAICLELSHNGHFAYITWGIGAIGLITAIVGFTDKSDK